MTTPKELRKRSIWTQGYVSEEDMLKDLSENVKGRLVRHEYQYLKAGYGTNTSPLSHIVGYFGDETE